MFPKWMYHATHGSRLFEDPDQLAAAGKGWEESPADVGLTPEAPTLPGQMLHFPVPQQPDDESVATAEEAAASAARAAKNAGRASLPTTPSGRQRSLRGKK